jgi:hypothetical protein
MLIGRDASAGPWAPTRSDESGRGEDIRAHPRSTGGAERRQARHRTDVRDVARKDYEAVIMSCTTTALWTFGAGLWHQGVKSRTTRCAWPWQRRPDTTRYPWRFRPVRAAVKPVASSVPLAVLENQAHGAHPPDVCPAKRRVDRLQHSGLDEALDVVCVVVALQGEPLRCMPLPPPGRSLQPPQLTGSDQSPTSARRLRSARNSRPVFLALPKRAPERLRLGQTLEILQDLLA